MAVLAVAFVVLAAVPVALTDADTGRTTTSSAALEVVTDTDATATGDKFYVSGDLSEKTITLTNAVTNAEIYLDSAGASIKLKSATTGGGKVTVYMATGSLTSEKKVNYYADSAVTIQSESSTAECVLSVSDGGYKLTTVSGAPNFAATQSLQYVKATYDGYTMMWTNGMASAKSDWSMTLVDAASGTTNPEQIVASFQASDDSTVTPAYELTVTYKALGSIKLIAPFKAADTTAGTITIEDDSGTAMKTTTSVVVSGSTGEVHRISGSFKMAEAVKLAPIITNGVTSSGSSLREVGGSASATMGNSDAEYAATIMVFKNTKLEADSTIYNNGYTNQSDYEAITLKNGLITGNATLEVYVGKDGSGSELTNNVQIVAAKQWTGAEIVFESTRTAAATGTINLAAANGSITVEGGTAITTVSLPANAVLYGQLSIAAFDNYTPYAAGTCSNLTTADKAIIAESASVTLGAMTALHYNGDLYILGSLTGAGEIGTGASNPAIYTPDGTKSNITLTGTQDSTKNLSIAGVAKKTLTTNSTTEVDLAAEQGFKYVILDDTNWVIDESYEFPEGITVEQTAGSDAGKIVIYNASATKTAPVEVTIHKGTTLKLTNILNSGADVAEVLVGTNENGTTSASKYATLIVGGNITVASGVAGNIQIAGAGEFELTSNGAVDDSKITVVTATISGTLDEVKVIGEMKSIPYPAYQKVIIPAGETATVKKLSNVQIYGQLQVDGTLIIEEDATLTIGLGATVGSTPQKATASVASTGSIQINQGATLTLANATVTAEGDIALNGTLNVDGKSTLTLKADMTESSTGLIATASDASISVSSGKKLTINGYLGSSSQTVIVKNSGTVVIDNSGIAIRDPAVNGAGNITISLVKSGASVEVKSFLVETANAKITVNDEGLQLAKVDDVIYKAAKTGAAYSASTKTTKVKAYNEVQVGASANGAAGVDLAGTKVTGSFVIKEDLTSSVYNNAMSVNNTMQISGSLSNSTATTNANGPAQKVYALLDSVTGGSSTTAVEQSIFDFSTSTTATYSGISFYAAMSVPSESTLTIAKDVIVENDGKLNVAGYVDMTATGVTALDNDGVLSVTGKIKTQTDIANGGTVNAAKYTSKEGSPEVTYFVYTSLATAVEEVIASTNTSTDKSVTIYGIVDVSVDTVVKSPATVKFATSTYSANKLTVGLYNTDATVTFEQGAKLESGRYQVEVFGTLYFADKTNDKTSKTVADVTVKTDDTVDITYTNIYTSLKNAKSGETVEITKADKDANGTEQILTLTKSVSIGDGVTLKIGSSAAALKLADGVTLTVNGVLDTAKDVTAETKFGKTASLATGAHTSAIALNGTIKASQGAAYGTSGTTMLSTGSCISGAYYTLSGVKTVSTLDIAEDNFAKIESSTVEIYGIVTAGDLSFAKTSSTTCAGIILKAGASDDKSGLTASSITLDGVALTIERYAVLTTEVKDAAGSVAASNVETATGTSSTFVISDINGNLFLSGTAVASKDSALTVSSGTVYAGTSGTSGVAFTYSAATGTNAMTVASGAAMNAQTSSNIAKIVVDGAFYVESGETATVSSMTVFGTVDVFEGSDTEAKGTLNIATGNVLYIGTDSETVTGATAVFNGPITVASGDKAVVIVAAGSAVDDDALESFGEASTEYYVQGSLWITAYNIGSDSSNNALIATYDNPTAKDAYFAGWYNADGDDVDDVVIGTDGFEAVYAYVETMIYQIIIKADQGIGDLYLNGNIMQKGQITVPADSTTGTPAYAYYAYWATVEAGTYEVTCKLANGYSGTAVLKDSDGKTLSGNKLTVSGNEYNQSLITENFQLTGIEKSGYTPAVEPQKEDNSLKVTDYLLIVLVILVVVLAVIVALRLMRS